MIKNFQESDFIDAFQDLPIYSLYLPRRRMFERNLRSNSSRQGTGGGHLTRWEPPAAKGAMRFFAASLPENVSLCRSHISSADGYHPVHVYLESTSMGKSPRIKPAS